MEHPILDRLRVDGLGGLAVLPDALICFIVFNLEDVKDVLSLSQSSRLLRVFAFEARVYFLSIPLHFALFCCIYSLDSPW